METWNPPDEPTPAERHVLKLCRKQPLWRFFRLHRHQILDEDIREAIRAMYVSEGPGRRPDLPERQALALLLQVFTGVADQDVPLLSAVDGRWQMVLDCMGATDPVLSQGTVFSFRERAREHGLMKLLLDKTVALARSTRGYSHTRLRAILDASPLVGAGRVEDTFNLLGRAISELLEVAAAEAGTNEQALAEQLEVTVALGSSVKAVLDVDWRMPQARTIALRTLLEQFERIDTWMRQTFSLEHLEQPPLSDKIARVHQILDQDTEPEPPSPGSEEEAPGRQLRRGTAKDRLCSMGDPDMRHGRKSKAHKFNGYKRHVATDADIPNLIGAVVLQQANIAEQEAAPPLVADLEEHFEVVELQIDRGYLGSSVVETLRTRGVEVVSKPPRSSNAGRFTKHEFAPDFEAGKLTCPAGVSRPMRPGKTTRFPVSVCHSCELRDACIRAESKGGRSVSMHRNEEWYRQMSDELSTPEGRQRRRERSQVEHALARVASIQGSRARYRGVAKNQFHLEAAAVVNNFHVLNGLFAERAAA